MENYTINEIAKLFTQEKVDSKMLEELRKDSRKGVLKLLEKWERQQADHLFQVQQLNRMSTYEKECFHKGYEFIAGVDEVGRGPIAGPVIAAAIILPKDFAILGVNDSKQLSDEKRESLFEEIQKHAISIGIGIIPANQIDEVNIYEATKLAMVKAIRQLSVKPQYLLIDAMKLNIDIPQMSIIKGDEKSVSIAASSIVAKVTRDRYMKRLSHHHPQYGFENHMGYGTKQHIEALFTYGLIDEHRKSFSPVKEVVSEGKG
jgi:ribonuclease HII